jgi:hypothetical protein
MVFSTLASAIFFCNMHGQSTPVHFCTSTSTLHHDGGHVTDPMTSHTALFVSGAIMSLVDAMGAQANLCLAP